MYEMQNGERNLNVCKAVKELQIRWAPGFKPTYLLRYARRGAFARKPEEQATFRLDGALRVVEMGSDSSLVFS